MAVAVDVYLEDRRTGLVTIYHDRSLYPDRRRAVFQWTDGECGCDCNRQLALWKAANPGVAMPDAHNLPCNRDDPTITVVKLVVYEAV